MLAGQLQMLVELLHESAKGKEAAAIQTKKDSGNCSAMFSTMFKLCYRHL